MSVTSAPPTAAVSESAAAAGATTGSAQAVVVQVLGAYGGDSVRNGLVQTLQATTGSGNILSGTITSVRADGTFTLETRTGTELSLHHPPELPLTVGSAVTLRIASLAPTPQVAILTIDGKLVSSQLTAPLPPPPTVGGNPSPPATPTAPALPPASNPLPPGLALPATLSSTLFAAISLEDEVAIEEALSGGVAATADPVSGGLGDVESVIATLVRAAPARVGNTPIPTGTRYLATLTIGDDQSAPAGQVRNAPPAPTQDAADNAPQDDTSEPGPDTAPTPSPTTTAASPPPPPDLSNFTALVTLLAGRVLPSPSADETLVETAVGTLAIPTPETPPAPGAAVQLKVTAVAPPVATEKPAATKPATTEAPAAEPVSPLQAAAQTLAAAAPALMQQIQTQLSLEPGGQLAAMILSFLGGLKKEVPAPRWPDPPTRKALVEAGRSDLAAKLDTDAGPIGRTQPAPPGEWAITVLPYLGLATTRPMRLYQRVAPDEEREKGGGDRFVIELQMVRLGALQFDGLVRERRFDLVMRSEKPLDDGLKALAEQTFRDSLLIAGWTGEMSCARTGPVPMIPLQPDGAGVGLSA